MKVQKLIEKTKVDGQKVEPKGGSAVLKKDSENKERSRSGSFIKQSGKNEKLSKTAGSSGSSRSLVPLRRKGEDDGKREAKEREEKEKEKKDRKEKKEKEKEGKEREKREERERNEKDKKKGGSDINWPWTKKPTVLGTFVSSHARKMMDKSMAPSPAALLHQWSTPKNRPSPSPKRTWRNNPLLNAVLLFVVPLPSIAFMWFLSHSCNVSPSAMPTWSVVPQSMASLLGRDAAGLLPSTAQVCGWATAHPLALLNVLFFLNVDVLFWLISLFQGSTWLIDPYWTIIPVLIAHFFAAHPAATFNPLRSLLSLALVWLWSIRLTHSYFRREKWELGAREDWRFADMRKRYGGPLWNVLSFPIVYLAQHLLLVGISLPFYSIHFPTMSPLPASLSIRDVLGLSTLLSPANARSAAASALSLRPSPPFDRVWDPVFAGLCLAGILVAYFADTQLRAFMLANEEREKLGKPKTLILNSGLWYYSRHPNYFGEQLWWWALSLFSVYLGQWYMAAGTFINSLCLATVTLMVERRMLEKPERRQAFGEYQRTTSVLVPWFKGSPATSSKKRN